MGIDLLVRQYECERLHLPDVVCVVANDAGEGDLADLVQLAWLKKRKTKIRQIGENVCFGRCFKKNTLPSVNDPAWPPRS